MVSPGNLRNKLLRELGLISICLGKGAHILEVPGGKPFHQGKGGMQVTGKLFNDFCAPARLPLSFPDFMANVPV